MTKLKTVYNDGDVALHFDIKELLDYDAQTVTVRVSTDDCLGSFPTRRGYGYTRGQFLEQFPVGSTHSFSDVGYTGTLPDKHYTDRWAKLDLKGALKVILVCGGAIKPLNLGSDRRRRTNSYPHGTGWAALLKRERGPFDFRGTC